METPPIRLVVRRTFSVVFSSMIAPPPYGLPLGMDGNQQGTFPEP
jgi:hypothetical protein